METLLDVLADDFEAYKRAIQFLNEDEDSDLDKKTDPNCSFFGNSNTANSTEAFETKYSKPLKSKNILFVKLPYKDYRANFFKLTDTSISLRKRTSLQFHKYHYDRTFSELKKVSCMIAQSDTSLIWINGPPNTCKRSLATATLCSLIKKWTHSTPHIKISIQKDQLPELNYDFKLENIEPEDISLKDCLLSGFYCEKFRGSPAEPHYKSIYVKIEASSHPSSNDHVRQVRTLRLVITRQKLTSECSFLPSPVFGSNKENYHPNMVQTLEKQNLAQQSNFKLLLSSTELPENLRKNVVKLFEDPANSSYFITTFEPTYGRVFHCSTYLSADG